MTGPSNVPRQARSNRERTESTRAALLDAARALFVERGYAATATPEVVARAGVTRGALYHHFEDKRELFQAVLEREAQAVADEIERAAASGERAEGTARDALMRGCDAYLAAMRVPGRTRLLLIDGPAVLGIQEASRLDDEHAARTLRAGLREALGARAADMALDALADLLSAAFDRAALSVEAGAPLAGYRAMLAELIDGLLQGGADSAAASSVAKIGRTRKAPAPPRRS